MARWTVDGRDYIVVWLNSKRWWEVYGGQPTSQIGDKLTVVFVPDDGVPDGQEVETPPQGEALAIAVKAQTAVGNVLKSRARIAFLRLVTQYPYGQEPGAIGMDGGGDPRAHPNQTDKAKPSGGQRINQGHLLQPGAFPEPQPEPWQAAALADHLEAVADGKPLRRFDTVNPPLSELAQRAADPINAHTGAQIVTDAQRDIPQGANDSGVTQESKAAIGADGGPRESAADPSPRTDAAPPIDPAQPAREDAAPDYGASAPVDAGPSEST